MNKQPDIRLGVEAWNQWRKDNPDVIPDLSGADLSGADLSGAIIAPGWVLTKDDS